MSIFKIQDGRRYLYQWDIDRYLVIDSTDNDITEVHFSGDASSGALRQDIEEIEGKRIVKIPQKLLENYGILKLYAYGSNHTQYFGQVEIRQRPKPEDYVYTDEEIKTWDNKVDKSQIVHETGDSETAVMSQKAVTEALKNFPAGPGGVEVVQQTGNSETAVMSQKATTKVIDNHEKRLTNIERHIKQDYILTDDDITYRKNIPVKACPYALFTKLGGMTYRHQENLAQFDLPDGATRNADGSVSLTQTLTVGANGWAQFIASVELEAGTYEYSISGGHPAHELTITGTSGFQELNGTLTVTEKTTITFADGTYKYSAVEEDTTETITMSITLVNICAELRDSKVTALKVHSKNLVDTPEIINQADVGGQAGTVSCYLTETCVVSSKANNVTLKGNRAVWRLEYISLSGKKNYITDTNMNGTGLIYGTEADPIVTINYRNTNMLTGSYSDIQIERGTVATEYSPFGVLATIELPEELQNLDGFGQGIGNYSNTIDLENGIYTKQPFKTIVLTGNEMIVLYSNTAYGNGITIQGVLDGKYKSAAGICTDTDKVGFHQDNHQNSLWLGARDTIIIWIGILDVLGFTGDKNGVNDFKQWLADRYANGNPVTIIYKSDYEEPIKTDITTDFDNFIEVEGGGSIEFVNEHNQAVPSEITYLLKEA